jgi:helix-turn-helix protein
VNVLSELWRNVPLGSVTMMQMGWRRDDVETAVVALTERGLVEGAALTETGRRLREEIETATDAQERSLVAALGDDADELLELLDPWARAIATNYLRT